MKITSKGQVTIPMEIREEAGLLPGTEVEFEIRRGTVVLAKAKGGGSRGRSMVKRLRGAAPKPGMSTDELMALLRGEP